MNPILNTKGKLTTELAALQADYNFSARASQLRTSQHKTFQVETFMPNISAISSRQKTSPQAVSQQKRVG